MHELSIAQALIEQVEEVAAREQSIRVERIVIVVGSLSGVEPDALHSAFSLVAEGTVASGAGLVIEKVAAKVKCLACGHESVAGMAFAGCEICGSQEVELSAGRELNIKSIEVEV
jgi:hydrogenase nickel incorporation protein HypA/HybF